MDLGADPGHEGLEKVGLSNQGDMAQSMAMWQPVTSSDGDGFAADCVG